MSVGDNKRIAKNTIFLYARMILVMAVTLYTTRVVLNTLGVLDYGIYNVVAGFVSMFAFLNTSLSGGVQRFYNYERGAGNGISQSDVYNSAILIQGAISIITLIVLETFGLWYINNIMVIPSDRLFAANFVFQCSVISLLILIMQIPYSAAIIAYERMDYYAYISIADVILRLVIVLVLPFVPFDRLAFYGILTILISIVDFLFYFWYVKKNFKDLKLNLSSGKRRLKAMLMFSGWNIFDLVVYTLKSQGVNMLLNAFFTPAINAARGIATQIMSATTNFAKNIDTAFKPQLVEKYANGDYDRVQKLMFVLSCITYACLFTIALPVILEINQILYVWLKGTVPDYTIYFTILVLINMLIDCFNTPLTQVVLAVGKLKHYQIYRSLLMVFILPVSWVVLKLGFNPASAFYVAIVFSILNQPLSMYLLHRVFPYSYITYMKKVIAPCLGYSIVALVVPLAVHFIIEESLTRVLIVLIVSVVSSVLSAYYIILSPGLRVKIKTIIISKINRQTYQSQ